MFVLFILDSNKIKTNVKSEAKCARDCFRILKSENLFSQLDVTFMQFLLRTTECKELDIKCVEYAKKQRALGFYEKQAGTLLYIIFPYVVKVLIKTRFLKDPLGHAPNHIWNFIYFLYTLDLTCQIICMLFESVYFDFQRTDLKMFIFTCLEIYRLSIKKREKKFKILFLL